MCPCEFVVCVELAEDVTDISNVFRKSVSLRSCIDGYRACSEKYFGFESFGVSLRVCDLHGVCKDVCRAGFAVLQGDVFRLPVNWCVPAKL